jgi:hypothetical protein
LQEESVLSIIEDTPTPTSESIDYKEDLYWEKEDVNPNQVIYDLENNKIIIPVSYTHLTLPTKLL